MVVLGNSTKPSAHPFFEGIILHLCPKAKATGVLNVQEKHL